ncbi:MAG: chemotaxis protein CheA [Zetaproteobacteria bacterium]|nr:chemotaxis protein CheA [Zetaproteobacteria bacterium]
MSDENDLTEIFISELEEVADSLEAAFVQYEQEPNEIGHIQSIFRLFHNVKGSSKTIGFDEISELAHHAESVMAKFKDAKATPSTTLMELLFEAVDCFRSYIEKLNAGENETSAIIALKDKLLALPPESLEEGVGAPTTEVSEAESGSGPHESDEVVEENIGYDPGYEESKGLYFFQKSVHQEQPAPATEETAGSTAPVAPEAPAQTPKVEPPKTTESPTEATPKAAATKPKAAAASKPQVDESIKVAASKIDEVLDLFGEQVILLSGLNFVLDQGPSEDTYDRMRTFVNQLIKISQDIQYTMITLRMVSLKPLFNRLGRTVRDVSKATGKNVEYVRHGENSELDKNIADALIDPLNHMIRNAVDHGLESTEERVQAGKPSTGKVTLSAQRSGGSFKIEISDDGKGLDREAILRKALKQNLIKPGDEHKLTDSQVYQMIFQNGFSTREQANEISGRGVGMDVVAQSIASLKGSCKIYSELGKGTTFSIQLPLSLAMFKGTIVEVSGNRYVIPNSDFKEIITAANMTTRKLSPQKSVSEIKDEIYTIVDLSNELKLNTPAVKTSGEQPQSTQTTATTDSAKAPSSPLAVLTQLEDENFAFIVDRIDSQEQIVLKELTTVAKDIKDASGGTILGDGQVSLVLELATIMRRVAARK